MLSSEFLYAYLFIGFITNATVMIHQQQCIVIPIRELVKNSSYALGRKSSLASDLWTYGQMNN
jgi:hypothetical protein